jgi:hypothetical protein
MGSSFIGMGKKNCLRYFAGNYILMLKTLLRLELHICKNGLIQKIGERGVGIASLFAGHGSGSKLLGAGGE